MKEESLNKLSWRSPSLAEHHWCLNVTVYNRLYLSKRSAETGWVQNNAVCLTQSAQSGKREENQHWIWKSWLEVPDLLLCLFYESKQLLNTFEPLKTFELNLVHASFRVWTLGLAGWPWAHYLAIYDCSVICKMGILRLPASECYCEDWMKYLIALGTETSYNKHPISSHYYHLCYTFSMNILFLHRFIVHQNLIIYLWWQNLESVVAHNSLTLSPSALNLHAIC